MAVTGFVHPDELMRNDTGRAGVPLSLTKPLGIGVLNNRHKTTGEVFPQAVAAMTESNAAAAAAARAAGVRCATDVTGFGLLGHLLKTARASGVSAVIDAAAVPYLDEARSSLAEGFVPGGSRRNLDWVRPELDSDLAEDELLLLADAQTSGGLLVAGEIPGAPVIGELVPRTDRLLRVRWPDRRHRYAVQARLIPGGSLRPDPRSSGGDRATDSGRRQAFACAHPIEEWSMGNDTGNRRRRIVIIGSGFGGLFAARKLKKADADITIINRTTHHLFQPLLYQVATGIISEGEIAPPTRLILRKYRNTTTLLGDVTDIDMTARTVTSEAMGMTTVTPYDSLIVAAGAGQSYFGNDHFAEYAPGMKTIDDALELRGRILRAFEQAEISTDAHARERLMTFVVVGAGPTGVELVGQIAELAHHTLRGSFRNIDPSDARIVLLDGADDVLPVYGGKLSANAR